MKLLIICVVLVAIVRADYSWPSDDNIHTCRDYDYKREHYQEINNADQSDFKGFLPSIVKKFVKDWQNNQQSVTQQSESESESDPERRYRPHRGARPVIVDTDIGAFPDDSVALAILHGLAERGEINLLGVIGSTRYEGVVEAISTINTFFGRPNIPVGVTHDPNAYTDQQGNQSWTEYIRNTFPASLHQNRQAKEAVTLYRRLLPQAPDKSVTILGIGEFTNLVNLLLSKRDAVSRLDGYRLVKRKVAKVISMAGKFPMTTAGQPEWNIATDKRAATIFARIWPTKVWFVGSELGGVVTCGRKYQVPTLSSTNPIAAAVWFGNQTFGSYAACYDAVAALMLTQDRNLAKFYCRVPGKIEILPDGENFWNPNTDDDPKMYYLRQKLSDKIVLPYLEKKFDSFLPELVPEPERPSTTTEVVITTEAARETTNVPNVTSTIGEISSTHGTEETSTIGEISSTRGTEEVSTIGEISSTPGTEEASTIGEITSTRGTEAVSTIGEISSTRGTEETSAIVPNKIKPTSVN